MFIVYDRNDVTATGEGHTTDTKFKGGYRSGSFGVVDMTFSEETMETFQHEVEEVVKEIKDHVIISVERYSLYIAFVLMAITCAILFIGTTIVWWQQDPDGVEYEETDPLLDSDNINDNNNVDNNNIELELKARRRIKTSANSMTSSNSS